MRIRQTVFHFAAPFLLLAMDAFADQANWLISDAPYRVIVTLEEMPRTPDAGVAIQIPDFGVTRNDLGDVAMLDTSTGKGVPLAKIHHGTGQPILLLAKGLAPAVRYHLYFGGNRVRAQGAWTPKASLLFETRRVPKDAKQDSWQSMEEAWRRAKDHYGAAFVPTIWGSENPWGESTGFLSHYSGYLLTPDGGDLYLYTLSSDASFVLVNGKYEFGWAGVHPPRADASTVTGKLVRCSPGLTQIDYYHMKGTGGPPPAMVLGWRKNDRLEAIPAEAWLHPGRARIGAVKHIKGWPMPDAKIQFSSYIGVNGQFYNETSCSVATTPPPGWQVEWQFEDGALFAMPTAVRIIPGTAPQKVTLRLRRGEDIVEGTHRLVFPLGTERASINNPEDVRRYLDVFGWEDIAHLNATVLRQDLSFLMDNASIQEIAPFAEAWLQKTNDASDTLWIEAQIHRLTALAQKNPANALQELRRIDHEARRKNAARLDFLEIELLVFALKDPTAPGVAKQYAFQQPNNDLGRLAKVRIGDFYRLTGKIADAIEQYKACQKSPKAEENERKTPAQDRAYSITITGLINAQDRQAAQAKLIEWELQHPMAKIDTDFLLLRARILMLYGRWNDALAELENFRSMQPESPYAVDADFYRAEAMFELGRKEDARKAWAEIVKSFPKHPLSAKAQEGAARK